MKDLNADKALMYNYWCQAGYEFGFRDAKNSIKNYEAALIVNDFGKERWEGYIDDAKSAFCDGYAQAQDDY